MGENQQRFWFVSESKTQFLLYPERFSYPQILFWFSVNFITLGRVQWEPFILRMSSPGLSLQRGLCFWEPPLQEGANV